MEKVWAVCERFARFGVPLHFTEMTVLSGARKTDDDWGSFHEGWDSTPEGERAQAEYVEKVYRVLFSHPAVEAVTWWDLSDARAWQGAPAGLVRKDLSAKPAYERLKKLVKQEWWTHVRTRADAGGAARVRVFRGEHRVTVRAADGRQGSAVVTASGEEPNRVVIRLGRAG